jgi:hypothetical protein
LKLSLDKTDQQRSKYWGRTNISNKHTVTVCQSTSEILPAIIVNIDPHALIAKVLNTLLSSKFHSAVEKEWANNQKVSSRS